MQNSIMVAPTSLACSKHLPAGTIPSLALKRLEAVLLQTRSTLQALKKKI